METQYKKYKEVDARSSNANSQYRQARSQFNPSQQVEGHQQLGNLASRAANLTAEYAIAYYFL